MPEWLHGLLTDDDVKTIEKTIQEVEQETTGEIVPMIVHRSATVGHVPVVLLLLFLVMAFVLDVPFWQRQAFGDALWPYLLWPVVILLGIRLLAPRHWVQRLCVSREDQITQVEKRAELEFYKAGLRKTDNSTGILLFLSLMERRAVVLADESIARHLPPETWQEVVDLLTNNAKKKQLAPGLKQALHRCGAIVTPHFPGPRTNPNELPNRLVLKE